MLEALACDRAVMAPPCGWLCDRAIAAVLITDSQQQASKWLERLMRHRHLACRLGAAGALYVNKHHWLSCVRHQWVALLSELVGRCR
jgi:hypothetical protein